MLRIRLHALTLKPLWLPLRAPLVTARERYLAREGLLLMLEDEEGRCGLGEAMPLPSFGTETLASTVDILGRFASRIAGKEVGSTPGEVDAFLRDLGGLSAVPAARHGLEVALLDLAGQVRGLPIRALLGAPPVELIRVNALLAGPTMELLARQARAARDEGFGVVKVKIGGHVLARDEEALAAVRKGGGEEIRVRLDPSAAWTEAEAIEALGVLARFDPELCEQPVAASEIASLGRVRAQVRIPIAADEALAEPGAAEALLNAGEGPRVDALALKPMVLGGLLPALELARRAARVGVASYVTSSLDGPVARTAAVHLAAALPPSPYVHGLAVGALFCDPGPEWLQPRGGAIAVPTGPGLGRVQ